MDLSPDARAYRLALLAVYLRADRAVDAVVRASEHEIQLLLLEKEWSVRDIPALMKKIDGVLVSQGRRQKAILKEAFAECAKLTAARSRAAV